MLSYLLEAASVARSSDPQTDRREAWIGAVGVRSDGTVVSARNEAVQETVTQEDGWVFPPAHAENRLARKLDADAVVYVARVKKDGSLAMARPCPSCERVLRSRRVRRVYYTVNNNTYGVWDLDSDDDRTVTRDASLV